MLRLSNDQRAGHSRPRFRWSRASDVRHFHQTAGPRDGHQPADPAAGAAKAISSLQIRQYPELFNTVITVTTTYPGADADLMQGFITDPMQKAVATADGIDYMTSQSSAGISVVIGPCPPQ